MQLREIYFELFWKIKSPALAGLLTTRSSPYRKHHCRAGRSE
jgi:hypothetical protein